MKRGEIFTGESMDFLEEYLNNPSPSGHEWKGQEIWMNFVRPYVDDFITNSYGTVVGVINPEANYKVVIEGHADEISWRVNYITKKGIIYVLPNGGTDYQVAPSKNVNIHTRKGIIPGIFGWPAIQTRKKNQEKAPKTESIFIDTGCSSKKEVLDLGIQIGDVITYTDEFHILNNNKFVSRGLDNRIGGFIIAQVARLIKENDVVLPFGLYVTNSVQEEVGKRGAEMINPQINPDVAIVTDVTHDTSTPMVDKKLKGSVEIGKGPVILYAPSVHNKLQHLILDTAEELNIPIQHLAKGKKTGTDTEAFAYGSGGVASALISLALRYMHTTKEMVHKKDVELVARLIYETLLRIPEGETFSYFKK